MFVTCFHEFRIYEFFLFSFKTRQDKDFVEIKNGAKTGYFHKKSHFAALLKENETFLSKIFVDS